MSGWRIRRATVEDADRLALVASATFLDAFAGIIEGEALLLHCRTVLSAETHHAYLAAGGGAWLAEAAGGAPLGYALVAAPDLPGAEDGDLELKRIYALSRTHGTGLGSALMQAAVDHARASRFRRLTLGVYHANARALAFYARSGFRRIGERKFRVGNRDYEDVVLALDLD